MRKRSPIPITITLLAVLLMCATVCCAAAQAAGKYIVGQERKNALIASVEENVDVLRSCLSPYSHLSQGGAPLSLDKEVSDMVKTAGK